MASLQGRPVADIARRFEAGHLAYVASIDEEPAAWGWAATRIAEIGEVEASLEIGSNERYLWNFVTLPAFRGMGIYPRLIDAIVRADCWRCRSRRKHSRSAGVARARGRAPG